MAETSRTSTQERESSDSRSETFGKMGDAVSDAKAGVQDRVASGADAGIDKTAEGLESAAEKIRSRTEGEEGMKSAVQEKAADAMEKTAGYLKEHDSKELMHDLEEFVKAHPLQAAVGALAAGYVIGKIAR
jgi:hypothetical protein